MFLKGHVMSDPQTDPLQQPFTLAKTVTFTQSAYWYFQG